MVCPKVLVLDPYYNFGADVFFWKCHINSSLSLYGFSQYYSILSTHNNKREGAECSTGAARACPGAAACSKSVARAHSLRSVRFLRSKWPLEKCCLVFFYSRHQLLLGSTLLRACYARVHTSIYIYIYIESIYIYIYIYI